MDGQRRTAAGELSELVGPIALKLYQSHRLHRFRSRAGALIAAMPPAERAMLDAYTAERVILQHTLETPSPDLALLAAWRGSSTD